mmetsp:Transcript_28214/g.79644  ORF Transcript_28214/g.79644 Transcript_28214/m.79644 type:complete len:382 (-) Transcript_28214:130-1275(-)|eukprot:CAMPEP_0117665238 /NCGR_PEP_ID=MMETSP0804-20121206/9698_1 /TAXON_ID=1074897 /ORGANISM="Tetraselmis astigmatica, Strain CCMP880" /LENGTH=381 /DNA_ID=CAMNT_0005472627 /DNA_START=186 /DNA_END=1331 /DNA_ORIENTATION=-
MGRKDKALAEVKTDPYIELAQHLRTKNGIPWRTGISQGDRVEYFRGKDFITYFKDHPEQLNSLPGIEPLKPGRTIEIQVMEVYHQIVRRQLAIRASRLHKKPKPGRKRLVKWPKKLVYEQDQALDDDSFYCWTFDRPTSPWLWLGSALMALAVFLLCLFPLAPYSVKISVVYFSMGLLGLIFFILIFRAAIFSFIWVLLGRHFWILPNITSDELGIVESFQPLYAITVGDDGRELPAPQWYSRFGVGIFVATALYGLHEYAPDKGRVKTSLGQAHNSLLDFLNLHEPGMMKIADSGLNVSMNMSAAAVNATVNATDAGETAEEPRAESNLQPDPTLPEEDPSEAGEEEGNGEVDGEHDEAETGGAEGEAVWGEAGEQHTEL